MNFNKNRAVLIPFVCLILTGCGSSSNSGAKPDSNGQNQQAEQVPSKTDDENSFYAYYTKLKASSALDAMSGPYADIVVNIDGKGKLIFARDYSYRPVWHFGSQNQAVEHLAKIQSKDKKQFDVRNDFSYARIIEQSNERIVIHWRYFPDPDPELSRDPEAVVHELYEIKKEGNVTRLYRPGTRTIEDWKALKGAISQSMLLTKDGIQNIQSDNATLLSTSHDATANPEIQPVSVEHVMSHWKFDEAKGNVVFDSKGNAAGTIKSHGDNWITGVSGTAIKFDGYQSRVEIPSSNAPKLGNVFVFDAWINLAALPWNTAPIMHQSKNFGAQGYYFGVEPNGSLILSVNGKTIISSTTLTRNQWVHVGATVSDKLEIYINGTLDVSKSVSTSKSIPEVPLLIGLNSDEKAASDGVRFDDLDEYNHFNSIYGIEGLIDEIKVYGAALQESDFKAIYLNIASNDLTQLSSGIPHRSLPDLETYPQTFGAAHTKLAFHSLWDNLWRVTDKEDIVVRFDNKPISFVYWRGTSHGMNLVTDKYWMSDQSVEMIIPNMEDPENQEQFNKIVSLAEHMSDKAALRTHVRLIENSPARAKIHWRYAAADVFGTPIANNAFIDEVHTIYPDGAAIRSVYYHAAENLNDSEKPGVVFYQDFQWLVGPDQKTENIMNKAAVSLAELNGPQNTLTYPYHYQTDVEGGPIPEKGNIAVLNSKTKWKVFGISQGNTFYPAGNEESSKHITYDGQPYPFAGPWNHWPVAQIPSDGRFSLDNDRVAHFALGVLEAFRYGTGSMMYGFVESDENALGDATKLQTLAKSWVTPPAITQTVGVKGSQVTYNKNERAFELTANSHSENIQINISASSTNPLKNPAFVVRHWGSNKYPKVTINNKVIDKIKMGFERDTDGTKMLVAYIPAEYQSQISLIIQR